MWLQSSLLFTTINIITIVGAVFAGFSAGWFMNGDKAVMGALLWKFDDPKTGQSGMQSAVDNQCMPSSSHQQMGELALKLVYLAFWEE